MEVNQRRYRRVQRDVALFEDFIFIIETMVVKIVRKSKNAEEYDFINISYIPQSNDIKPDKYLNFIMSFTSIKSVYKTVAIIGRRPIIPKLLNIKDKTTVEITISVFDSFPSLSL